MAGDTIEQVVVKFIADNASYLRDIKQMQEETHKYGVYTSNLIEKLNTKLGTTSKSYKQVNTSAQQFHKTASSGSMSMFQHYTNLGAQLGFLVRQYVSVYAAVRTVSTVLKEGINFNKFKEETTVAFTVMMRSADAAKAKMEELYKFAVESPMTFQETAKGARQLMAYGFQAEELVDTMKMLGTVGKAVGASMDDMAYVYGTLKSQGRAYSRDLLQFGMRGIPIYEELAKVMDKPVSKIQKLASEGKIGFAQVEKAFANMTNEGGRFSGILDAWMSTLAGKSSMLSDIWQKNAGEMTKGLVESLKTVVDSVTEALETSEVQKIFRNLGLSLGLVVEYVIAFAKALIALRTPLLVLITLNLLRKIAQQLAISFITLPKKIYETSSSLMALVSPATMASGAVLTLKGAINSLTTALAANPIFAWVTALTMLLGAIPILQAKLKNLEADTKDKLATPGTFRTDFLKTQWEEHIDYLSYGGTVPLLALDYIKIAQEISDKWGVTIEDVLGNAKSTKVISDTMLKQIDAFRKQNASELAKRKGAENRNVPKPTAADIPESLLKIAEASFVEDAQSLLVGITGGHKLYPEVISSWELMGKEAISSFIAGTKYEVGRVFEAKSLFGESMPTEDVIKLYEKAYDSIITYYNLLKDAEDATGATFNITPLQEYAAKLRKDIDYLKGLKKTAEESEKAFSKYHEEIASMSDEIDKYVALGFNPTKIEELDYAFNKLTKDMKANKGIWEFITDPKLRKDYTKLFRILTDFQVGQIKEAQAFELANAKVSKELEYQLALLEGQAFYANQELAMFDVQLETQKQLLELAIARGGEGVDAAREELAWVIKIGEVQRRNLERELALTRAKKFLAGESDVSEAFWNRVTVGLATSLGMKPLDANSLKTDNNQITQMNTKEMAVSAANVIINSPVNTRGLTQYENGTSYVPSTGPAILHKGEAVIPANINKYQAGVGLTGNIDKDLETFFGIFGNMFTDLGKAVIPTLMKSGVDKEKISDVIAAYLPIESFFVSHTSNKTRPGHALNKTITDIMKSDEFSRFTSFYSPSSDILNGVLRYETSHPGVLNFLSKFGGAFKDKKMGKAMINSSKLSFLLGAIKSDNWINDLLMERNAYYLKELAMGRNWQTQDGFMAMKAMGYANGTGGAKRGPAIVGEKGPELVYMNGGETVIPNHMLNGYAKGTLKENDTDLSRILTASEQFGKVLQFLNLQGSEVGKVLSDQKLLWPVVGKAVGESISEFDIFNKIIGMVTNPVSTLATTILEIGSSLLDFGSVIESENALLLDTIERTMAKIKEEVDYYTDQLNTIIDKNIASQWDLYELGLITATQYEAQVSAANATRPPAGTTTPPDVKPEDLPATIEAAQLAATNAKNEADLLKTKSEFVKLMRDVPFWATTIKKGIPAIERTSDLDTLSYYAKKMSEGDVYFTGLLGVNEGKIIGNQMLQFIAGLAAGTSFVPNDMMANIHQGEMVVPRKFSDSIRSGELTLGGNNRSSSGDTYVINIAGSVLTENELIDVIAKGTRKRMVRGYV